MEQLGWFLIVLGSFGLVVGMVGGAREVLMNPPAGPEDGGPWGAVDTVKEILKLGGWRALAGLGFALLVLGLILTGTDVFGDGEGDGDTASAVMSLGGVTRDG